MVYIMILESYRFFLYFLIFLQYTYLTISLENNYR